jgi:hypothetical protein
MIDLNELTTFGAGNKIRHLNQISNNKMNIKTIANYLHFEYGFNYETLKQYYNKLNGKKWGDDQNMRIDLIRTCMDYMFRNVGRWGMLTVRSLTPVFINLDEGFMVRSSLKDPYDYERFP